MKVFHSKGTRNNLSRLFRLRPTTRNELKDPWVNSLILTKSHLDRVLVCDTTANGIAWDSGVPRVVS